MDARELADVLVNVDGEYVRQREHCRGRECRRRWRRYKRIKPTTNNRKSEPTTTSAAAASEAGSGDIGHALVNRKVVKRFFGVPYDEVRSFDAKLKCYMVVYADGDMEELEAYELEEIIVGGIAKVTGKENKVGLVVAGGAGGSGGGGGGRSRQKPSMAAAVKEMPKPMSLEGCGAGYLRKAQAVYYHGKEKTLQPVGAWIASDGGMHASVVFRQGMDARMYPADEAIAPEDRYRVGLKLCPRISIVPGYIGVSTQEDDKGRFSIPWTPDYDGTYHVNVWDSERQCSGEAESSTTWRMPRSSTTSYPPSWRAAKWWTPIFRSRTMS